MKELISRANFDKVIDHPGSAAVLALDAQGCVLLLENKRMDYPHATFEIPGGIVEKGETPGQTARRELIEETGYTFNLAKHYLTLSPSVGYSNEWISVFAALVTKISDTWEFEPRFFAREEVKKLIEKGCIIDAQTMAVLGKWLLNEDLTLEPPKVNFICSGNYYRSRFCEIYYNHLTQSSSADSRGLLAYKGSNEGMISIHTLEYLAQLKLPVVPHKFPEQLEENHLNSTQKIIAVCEREHRVLMKEMFPEWETKTEYWQVNDIDFSEPKEALPTLKLMVEALVKRNY